MTYTMLVTGQGEGICLSLHVAITAEMSLSSCFPSTHVERVKVRWEAAAASRTSHLGTLDSTGNAPPLCSTSLSGFNVFSIKYHFSLTAVRNMKKIHGRS